MISIFQSMFTKKPTAMVIPSPTLEKPKGNLVRDYDDRLPAFPQGIPAVLVDVMVEKNEDLIKQIILARGLAGKHNLPEVDHKILAPIRHLASMTHLVPASEKSYFRMPGGLFLMCLEMALLSVRSAPRRMLSKSPQEERRHNEELWTQAAFLTGLFSEAISTLSKVAIYAETEGDESIECHLGVETLNSWLVSHNIEKYHLRWKSSTDRSLVYALAGKAIQEPQTRMLAEGEPAIYRSLISALHDLTDLHNPLTKISQTVRCKLINRDENSDPSRYGKPLAGMHIEPWLIDAMRSLVAKKRWRANEDNGRLWIALDGLFLVWPIAGNDMKVELKDSECPFVPNTTDILAEIMVEAGIIEKSSFAGSYLCAIAIPDPESEKHKHFTAIKIARFEILFPNTESSELNIETLDIDIQIQDEWPLHSKARSPSDEEINGAVNADEFNDEITAYDDDYASDYTDDLPSTPSHPVENPMSRESVAGDDAELLSALLTTRPKKDKPIQDAMESVAKCSDDKSTITSLKSYQCQREMLVRAELLLKTLKEYPEKPWEVQPDGLTRIYTKGLARDFDIQHCLNVLKTTNLLALINGVELGIENHENKEVRYFQVKRDFSDGKL